MTQPPDPLEYERKSPHPATATSLPQALLVLFIWTSFGIILAPMVFGTVRPARNMPSGIDVVSQVFFMFAGGGFIGFVCGLAIIVVCAARRK